MATAKSVLAAIDSLSKSELKALEAEWGKLGSVKRRWLAFVGGVICGAAGMFVAVTLFSCSKSSVAVREAPACPPVTATFCVKGPTVVP